MSNDLIDLIELSGHAGFARCFAPGALTIGLILPLETHPGSVAPTMLHHVAMAQAAEASGFASLWMRDIPFYDPKYGDVGQVFEPLTYIAYLGAHTTSIALGTAGIVLPIRDPLLLAKQVATIDQLLGARMLLGISSGDRASDYPLFGVDIDSRSERLRDAFSVYRTVSEHRFPAFESTHFGHSDGALDLVPKPPLGRTPAIAVGRAQQDLSWIASHMDGFMSATPAMADLSRLASEWGAPSKASAQGGFKPLGIGGFLDLVERRSHPVTRILGGIRCGSQALLDYLDAARESGICHFAMNPSVSRRPYAELMDELASEVVVRFPSGGRVAAVEASPS